MEGLSVLIATVVGGVLVAVAAWLLQKGKADEARQQIAGRDAELTSLREELKRELALRAKAEEKSAQIGGLEQRVQALGEQLASLTADNTTLRERVSQLTTQLTEERKQAEEKLQLLNAAREQLTVQFKQLAAEILEDKSKRFTDQNKQNLDGLLNPLREQIKEFEKKVQDTYDKESKDRVSLHGEILRLKELNQKIGEDALNLTKALKGESKTRGIWGEMILEQVLEKSGLTRDREYQVQASFVAEDGRRLQPDVIVHLPEGKQIIVDSKVSLTAYERFCACEEEAGQALAIKEHCDSLRNHFKELSAKNYQNLKLRTLDYVLMFVPIEPAYYEAARHDPELFGDALERNIVIVTPSTLLATLRTIQNIWRFEYQNRHAMDIADRAGKMYDKFVGFVNDLDDLGKKIAATQRVYDDAFNKLKSGRGNLIKQVEDLKSLGAKASKSLSAEITEAAADEAPLLAAVTVEE